MNTERLLKAKEVAERLAISRSTVYTWFWEGKLKGVQIGGHGRTIRIPESEIERIMNEID